MSSDTILAVHKIRAIEGKLTLFIIVEYSGMIQKSVTYSQLSLYTRVTIINYG